MSDCEFYVTVITAFIPFLLIKKTAIDYYYYYYINIPL